MLNKHLKEIKKKLTMPTLKKNINENEIDG
jgi:hypothetical protein